MVLDVHGRQRVLSTESNERPKSCISVGMFNGRDKSLFTVIERGYDTGQVLWIDMDVQTTYKQRPRNMLSWAVIYFLLFQKTKHSYCFNINQPLPAFIKRSCLLLRLAACYLVKIDAGKPWQMKMEETFQVKGFCLIMCGAVKLIHLIVPV